MLQSSNDSSHGGQAKTLLFRARLLLEEGHSQAALSTLESLQVLQPPREPAQRQEYDYLLGWCYTQLKKWQAATQVLEPLARAHLSQTEETEVSSPGNKLTRVERRARCLLQLGQAAINLSRYDDATRHYLACLTLLKTQKNTLAFRGLLVQAHYGIGTALAETGMYQVAAQHYEEALAYWPEEADREERAHIHHGLCYAYRALGRMLEARQMGLIALDLYMQLRDAPMEGRMHNLLGRIEFLLAAYPESSAHYTESLSIASSMFNPRMVMLNCIGLSDLRLTEGHLDEARRYSDRALDLSTQVDDNHMVSKAYLAAGKLAQIEAGAPLLDAPQRQRLLEIACENFAKAHDLLIQTQARDDLAEIYGRWGQALEEMHRPDEALSRWRSAYQILAHEQDWS